MSDFAIHYVYILRSVEHPERRYVGATSNLDARLKKHNQGGCSHTSQWRPWRVETAIAFEDKHRALAFERYLKSGSGREFARRHFYSQQQASAQSSTHKTNS